MAKVAADLVAWKYSAKHNRLYRPGLRRRREEVEQQLEAWQDKNSADLCLEMAKVARADLKGFAECEAPRTDATGLLAMYLWWLFRPLLQYLPFGVGSRFYQKLTALGGMEQVHLLVMVARLDKNGDGKIDQGAKLDAEALVKEAIGTCRNLATVGALMIGTTAFRTGFRAPSALSARTIELLGPTSTEFMAESAYLFNMLALGLVRIPPNDRK